MGQKQDARQCQLTDELTRALFDRYRFGERITNKSRSLKRALTTLRKEVADIQDLMEGTEQQTVREALQAIDRWTGKVERAAKERERVAKAEEAHRAARRAEARKLLLARYPAEDYRQQLITAYALNQARRPGHIPVCFRDELLEEVRWCVDRLHGDRAWAAKRTIKSAYESEIDAAAVQAEWQDVPVDALFQENAIPKIDAELATAPEACAGMIAEIDALLARAVLEHANPNAGKAKQGESYAQP